MAEPDSVTLQLTDCVIINKTTDSLSLGFSMGPDGPKIHVEVWRPVANTGLSLRNSTLKNSRVPAGSITFGGEYCRNFIRSIADGIRQYEEKVQQYNKEVQRAKAERATSRAANGHTNEAGGLGERIDPARPVF